MPLVQSGLSEWCAHKSWSADRCRAAPLAFAQVAAPGLTSGVIVGRAPLAPELRRKSGGRSQRPAGARGGEEDDKEEPSPPPGPGQPPLPGKRSKGAKVVECCPAEGAMPVLRPDSVRSGGGGSGSGGEGAPVVPPLWADTPAVGICGPAEAWALVPAFASSLACLPARLRL